MKPCPLCAELNFDDAVNCNWFNESLSGSLALQTPAHPAARYTRASHPAAGAFQPALAAANLGTGDVPENDGSEG